MTTVETGLEGGDAATLLAQLRQAAPGAHSLARGLSLAARCTPAHLRRMRLRAYPHLGAELEGQLWFSAIVSERSSTVLVLRPDVAALLRSELAADPEELGRAWDVITSFHGQIPEEIALEERLRHMAATGAGPDELAQELWPAVRTLLDDQRGLGVARWAVRAIPSLPAEARATEPARLLAAGAMARIEAWGLLGRGWPGLPEDPSWVVPAQVTTSKRIRVGIRRGPTTLTFVDSRKNPRLPTIELPATRLPVVELQVMTHRRAIERRMVVATPGASMDVPLDARLELRTLTGDTFGEAGAQVTVEEDGEPKDVPNIEEIVVQVFARTEVRAGFFVSRTLIATAAHPSGGLPWLAVGDPVRVAWKGRTLLGRVEHDEDPLCLVAIAQADVKRVEAPRLVPRGVPQTKELIFVAPRPDGVGDYSSAASIETRMHAPGREVYSLRMHHPREFVSPGPPLFSAGRLVGLLTGLPPDGRLYATMLGRQFEDLLGDVQARVGEGALMPGWQDLRKLRDPDARRVLASLIRRRSVVVCGPPGAGGEIVIETVQEELRRQGQTVSSSLLPAKPMHTELTRRLMAKVTSDTLIVRAFDYASAAHRALVYRFLSSGGGPHLLIQSDRYIHEFKLFDREKQGEVLHLGEFDGGRVASLAAMLGVSLSQEQVGAVLSELGSDIDRIVTFIALAAEDRLRPSELLQSEAASNYVHRETQLLRHDAAAREGVMRLARAGRPIQLSTDQAASLQRASIIKRVAPNAWDFEGALLEGLAGEARQRHDRVDIVEGAGITLRIVSSWRGRSLWRRLDIDLRLSRHRVERSGSPIAIKLTLEGFEPWHLSTNASARLWRDILAPTVARVTSADGRELVRVRIDGPPARTRRGPRARNEDRME